MNKFEKLNKNATISTGKKREKVAKTPQKQN